MTEPTYEERKPSCRNWKSKSKLKSALASCMDFKVSEKGGVSVYGTRPFPGSHSTTSSGLASWAQPKS